MKKASAFVRPMKFLPRRVLAGSVVALLVALAPASHAVDKIWTGAFGWAIWDDSPVVAGN